jgi:acyl carrier protein
MLDKMSVSHKVREYIVGATFTDASKISEDSLIFKEGYLDSMGLISLISFLEEDFGISTQDRDLVEENFESINAISNFVLQKKSA